MPPTKEDLLRQIPSVDVLLQDEDVQCLAESVPRRILVHAVRAAVEEVRRGIVSNPTGPLADGAIRDSIVAHTRDKALSAVRTHFCKAINATGIILHTGLGRAVLAPKALERIQHELSGYSVLQLGIETGKRSQRDARIEWLLRELTGCEAATVVNNNAAATSLVLNTVAKGKEVIVSRGQLVEIGGSFRLPEVMEASGVTLVEVGTTNKTHARDYERAITENTAAILRVHPSNYKIMGFSEEVALDEMIAIAHANGLALIDDIGAGAVTDFTQFGFRDQPMLHESVRAGSDLITSSADKLIGASQGGIILGTSRWIEAVRKNPLARAMRVGKLTLAVIEATLMLFLDEKNALREVPTLRMLTRSLDELNKQATRIADALQRQAPAAAITVVDGASQMGSGSLPTQNIATRLVSIVPEHSTTSKVAARLRHSTPPVFTRIQKEQILLDPRTLQDGDEGPLVNALVAALADVGA